jgi:hypothetical protein
MEGKREEQLGQHGRGAAADAWERRKADQAARRAAIMADPVRRFHLLHGRRPARETAPCANEAGGEEPGTA